MLANELPNEHILREKEHNVLLPFLQNKEIGVYGVYFFKITKMLVKCRVLLCLFPLGHYSQSACVFITGIRDLSHQSKIRGEE